jgi:hypothetical protein
VYSINTLRLAYAWARGNPDQRLTLRRPGEFDQDLTGAEWRTWFRACLDAKINRALSRRGRKEQPEWQAEMRRAARALNTPRLAIHWLPRELRARFAGRIS